MKKIIGILLALAMVFSTSVISFAGTIQTENLNITPLTDTTYMLSDGKDTAIMKFSETSQNLKVEITNASGVDSDNGYFLIDKTTGNIYSSFTGESINTSDIITKGGMQIDNSEDISTTAVGDVVWSKTYKVSYAKLAKLCNSASSNLTIASAIITCVAAVAGVTISTTAIMLISVTTIGFEVIKAGIKSKSSSHGISAKVQKVEIQKHQGGRLVTGYSYKIKSVGAY